MAGRKRIYDETKTISFRIHPTWEQEIKQLVKEKLKELKANYINKKDNNDIKLQTNL